YPCDMMSSNEIIGICQLGRGKLHMERSGRGHGKHKAVNKKVPNKLEPNNSCGSQVLMFLLHFLHVGCPNRPLKFLGTVKFGNDHVVKIMGYGDYQIGNVTISQVYYVEGLGHNLFSVGQFVTQIWK
nr:integrase, catalytic region, zinc finger, CCHC-type, peptidase aspartic, catalytic [Tanacetum cinerariifolium]